MYFYFFKNLLYKNINFIYLKQKIILILIKNKLKLNAKQALTS
jgi:hypothetical protein